MSMYERPSLPDPQTAPELFDGVLMRRVFAYLIDVAILVSICAVVGMVSVILGFFTLGIPWLLLPILIPLIILGYYAATLGSPMRATIARRVLGFVA